MNYAGDISPTECWQIVESDSTALVIDVRTAAEWAYVGIPQLPEGRTPVIRQQWQIFPHMDVDHDFVGNLRKQLAQVGADSETALCFLCRSGVRSLAAANAMAAAGYEKAYNIAGGFEGDLDSQGHRGNSNGWKKDGLPWKQG